MKIKFTKRSVVRTVNPKDPKAYAPGELSYVEKWFEEGKVYEMSDEAGQRWLRRGVAEEVVTGRALPEPEPEVVKTPAPVAKHLGDRPAK